MPARAEFLRETDLQNSPALPGSLTSCPVLFSSPLSLHLYPRESVFLPVSAKDWCHCPPMRGHRRSGWNDKRWVIIPRFNPHPSQSTVLKHPNIWSDLSTYAPCVLSFFKRQTNVRSSGRRGRRRTHTFWPSVMISHYSKMPNCARQREGEGERWKIIYFSWVGDCEWVRVSGREGGSQKQAK